MRSVSSHALHVRAYHAIVSNNELSEQLTRFWQLEDVAGKSSEFTYEESVCERHFLNNVSRNFQGRYIVKLPFKEQANFKIGKSREIALKRLYGIERRLIRDPVLKTQYMHFIHEYLSLKHMRLVSDPDLEEEGSCYLPHHCVFRAFGQSSKIRVVFDASSKTSTGISLNDVLLTGPVVQQDLTTILIRFRTFQYVLVADIIKMYRQILVHRSQTKFQRILWRDDFSSQVNAYELGTITYGTASASYLATRCLKHLAENSRERFPVGAAVLLRDFYMDDMLSGADTLEAVESIRDETIALLRSGGFELSKWASNVPRILQGLTDRNEETVAIDDDANSNVLGIHWNQSQDFFSFTYEVFEQHDTASKRIILSKVSRLFDPLGLLGPVVVVAKLILQDLWQSGVQWDESVPLDIHSRWNKLKHQLIDIDSIKIPRCVKLLRESRYVQIHGFCDASQNAYGACVYMRSEINNEEFRSELLCSKSRVAPLKAISLPQLELAAALLLAQLITKIKESFDMTSMEVYLWSDSTITLNWISSPSRRWATFVANRVGKIQRLTKSCKWRHIASASNPADILSRGSDLVALANSSLWWHGPTFLAQSEDYWPDSDFVCSYDNLPEQRLLAATVIISDGHLVIKLLCDHSSLTKTCRIISYCLRLAKGFRPGICSVTITPLEIRRALSVLCKIVQQRVFAEEYASLLNNKIINKASKLIPLNPFMHSDALIQVGGRLKNSDLSFETCHPILLPRSHVLTERIIEREHHRTGHGGVQATMAAVRLCYWPVSLRSTTRRIVRNCVTCFKARPRLSEALMGSLPAERVFVSRPFSHCGVDYAGPLLLREGKRRNAKFNKAYSAILATKATHVELVSDLTSEAFIAALKRFMSRRGKPICLYSDNGSTFVGAHRQLKELHEMFKRDQKRNDIQEFLCDQETSWKFIPPNAPHFGGLWEAAVKSFKYYIHRIVGRAHLTFEEMQTVLCEIESILNSRPLTPFSEDPNDLTFLTPGHFLIGTALNSCPYSDLLHVNENRLIRWERVEQLRQHFWHRWSLEYLHHLQGRSKWRFNKGEQLQLNQMVLVKQPGLAPMQWMIGRIEDVHTGSDGVARSAKVRTARGLFIRPLSKLAILPIESEVFDK